MKKEMAKCFSLSLVSGAALALAGCWTPPNANVQPKGAAGLIQDSIVVTSVKDPARVQAIDQVQRTVTLGLPDGSTATYPAGVKVKHLEKVQVGDTVKATVTEDLVVYALDNGRLPDGTTAEALGVNARVQQVDPSYRLLTLQSPNGQCDTVKPDLDVKMKQMEPGDSVAVKPVELTAIKVEKH
jgi:hypothetical protein